MKVLIAEGHRGVRETLMAGLAQHGLHVAGVAVDGIEAIEKTRRLAPDIVVLDFHMPRCGGLEAARVIRSDMPHIKIILLTMWGEEAYSRAATECGAIACFPKDVSTRNLISAMAN
jgi:DNA-binding NarL/FixJ family response regulator